MSDAIAMEAMLKRWEESGLSLRAFGQKEEIPYSRLVYWRRKLRPGSTRSKKPKKKSAAKPEFVPVKVVPDEAESAPPVVQVIAWLPNGVSLDIPPGVDQQELQRLVDVLASC